MRADAQRNRRRLLDAAVAAILDAGGAPTFDAVAQRAGVGIGTLYRHFPDRQALLHGVTRHVLERTIAAGEAELGDGADGATVLRRYLHLAVDNGVGVVNIVHPLIDRPDWPDLQTRAEALLRAILDRAKAEGAISAELTAADLASAVIRFSRPLGIGLPADRERAIAHRHIDTYVDGLLAWRLRSEPHSR